MKEKIQTSAMEINANIDVVSKDTATEYAVFCVKCDRENLPLISIDDYINQYCKPQNEKIKNNIRKHTS